MVLIDMVYNLGKTGFNWKKTPNKQQPKKTYGYPNFWKKLAQRDIEGMVTECVRNRTNKGFIGRNKAIQELIRETPDNWTKKGLKNNQANLYCKA